MKAVDPPQDQEPDPSDYPARAVHYRKQAHEFRVAGDLNMAKVCEEFGRRCDELAAEAQPTRNRKHRHIAKKAL
ncbi:hypothetical protein [Mycobacteroides abscessus]